MDILGEVFCVDFILVYASVDRRAGYVQQVGGVLYIATGTDKGRYEFITVVALLVGLGERRGENKMFEVYSTGAAMNGSIQRGVKLAQITGPVVGTQPPLGGASEPDGVYPLFVANIVNHLPGDTENVLGAVAQWRHRDDNLCEQVEKGAGGVVGIYELLDIVLWGGVAAGLAVLDNLLGGFGGLLVELRLEVGDSPVFGGNRLVFLFQGIVNPCKLLV